MVSPLEIQILAGRQAGRRLVLQHSPIVFGRDEHCDLLIDLPAVSRRHGQLVFDPQARRWQLHNESPNVLQSGWKRIGQQPLVLDASRQISLNGQPLMKLTPQADDQTAPATDNDAQDQAPAKARLSGKARLWLAIGVLWLIVLVLVFIFATLSGGSATSGPGTARAGTMIPELTALQIRDEIFSPPPINPPDARRSDMLRQEASELFALSRNDPTMLYETWQRYRLALSLTMEQVFESGVDQRRYQVVQQRLADQIIERYQNATNQFRSGQYQSATESFRSLMQFYPAGRDSTIARNIEAHLSYARNQTGRR